jgi:hypothetical protein
MLLATTHDGRRVLPSRDEAGFCPDCGLLVVPRMGAQRVHHWAHAPGSECAYGRGMTEWHYRWILRHHNREGWQIEHRHGDYRFDCFHSQKQLTLEFQSQPQFEYMIAKTEYCCRLGLRVNWILHDRVFRQFLLHGDEIVAPTQRRLNILSVLSYCAVELPCAAFYVDLARPLRQPRTRMSAGQELPPGVYQISSVWRTEADFSYVDFFRLRIASHRPGSG